MGENRTAEEDGYLHTHPSIIFGVTQGKAVSQERFYKIYKPLVVAIASKKGIDADDMDELVQDVINDFFKSADRFSYDPEKQFRNYFYGIVKHHVADLMAKKKRQKETTLPEPETIETLSGSLSKDPDDEQEWMEFLHKTADAEIKQRVPPVVYQVYQLFLRGKEPKEISKQLDIALSSVYNHKKRAQDEYTAILMEIKTGLIK